MNDTRSPNAPSFSSIWSATAPPAVSTPALTASRRADVAIIGAGITGLSTALHLAERGREVCVLDAAQPGFGASGRNGGQVIPGLKHDPDDLLRMLGREQAAPLIELASRTADIVFDLIARYRLDCDAVRAGWIQPAHCAATLDVQRRRVAQWQARGAPVEMLDQAEVAARTGSAVYPGGLIDRRAGSVHPLKYLRGLLDAAMKLGASVHGRSKVCGLTRAGNGWRVVTANGYTVDADNVLIATNGYTDTLWPRLKQTLIAANSFMLATEPLPAAIGATVLPGGEVASDSRRLLLYFRKDAAGRLLLGGRGRFTDPDSAHAWAHLERSLARLFPQVKGVAIQHRWAGRVAITRDGMPHLHMPAPGLTIALGYNGRGIAMATALGQEIARCLTERRQPRFPVSPIQPIPFHGMQRLYFSAAVAWYRTMDQLG
ncbi:FAD-dependent oxidoreductase [Burkholderia multivorans]|uniref:NAD(P)/FAD-dependent oxidoreductase n=1 Tax=Burkholderia multivorans TaxID=87883 RepID=UPI000CFF4BC7|nr:FAD-binding oxidoreductase [Burkholderia multivorans]PRG05098.1 FAD-dependent oxidoreductase [Burkholderia multivorans]